MQDLANRLRALGALFVPLGSLGAEAAYTEAGLEPPAPRIRRRLELDVFTPGGAVSLLPVESLYRMWADPQARGRRNACAFGAARHMYLGDSAHHVKAILRRLGLEVPEGFEAMPDHISLLCELAAIFAESGNVGALGGFLREHFDWTATYASELASRRAELEACRDESMRASECVEAIDHVLALLAEVDDVVAQLTGRLERRKSA